MFDFTYHIIEKWRITLGGFDLFNILSVIALISLPIYAYKIEKSTRSVGGKSARNERRKLTATFLNNLSIASIAYPLITHSIAPLGGPTSGGFDFTSHDEVGSLIRHYGFLFLSLFFHVAGRWVLSKIED